MAVTEHGTGQAEMNFRLYEFFLTLQCLCACTQTQRDCFIQAAEAAGARGGGAMGTCTKGKEKKLFITWEA